jgi:DNA-binding LytR/AlgR family response regulator
VIVDDEPLARDLLGRLCAERREIDVVALAANGREAIDVITRSRPELVLMDVELGDMTGYDVLRTVRREVDPLAIMVSGRDDRASQAFDADAVDFVSKPVDGTRLHCALERAAHRLSQKRRVAPPRALIGERDRHLHFIDATDLDFLEVDGNYVTLHVGGERYLMRQSLTTLAESLEPQGFLRIERSLLVNMGQVRFAERTDRGTYTFTLKRGQRLTSSRERSPAIARLLRGARLPPSTD